MGMRSVSSDGAASFFEARGAGGDCKIVSSLGSKEVARSILGFLFLWLIPSDDSESCLAGCVLDGEGVCSERSCSTVNLGLQLVIEAISADVIMLMGLEGVGAVEGVGAMEGVGAVCSADSVEDGLGGAGEGKESPCHVQLSWVGVDG